MNRNRRRSPQQLFPKTLRDVLIVIVLAIAAIFGWREASTVSPNSGNYTAIDGDSLRKGGQDIRLHGIDAPELQQSCSGKMGQDYPCGQDAKRALAGFIRGKPLTCKTRDTDRYARLVATCHAGAININAEMIRLGWATAYTRHSGAYRDEEVMAQNAKRGIWQGQFETPEKWRNRNRTTQGAINGAANSDDD